MVACKALGGSRFQGLGFWGSGFVSLPAKDVARQDYDKTPALSVVVIVRDDRVLLCYIVGFLT